MRSRVSWCLALGGLLTAGDRAWAQAGRYIPLPRLPGGGSHFAPHVPLHWFVDSETGLAILAVLAAVAVVAVGWCLGLGLGRWWRGVPACAHAARGASAFGGPSVQVGLGLGNGPAAGAAPSFVGSSVPPMQDLILSTEEVADKRTRTVRLLEMLSGRDRDFEPAALAEFVRDTFYRVQRCWQERDYGPVADRLMPEILARHEGLLKAMRQNREINRIDDLAVRRLEFVRVVCPEEPGRDELTALITFEARVYFVHDRTGAFLRGLRVTTWYQEFWTFRRDGDGWRLALIQESWDDAALKAPNEVAGMGDTELHNVEQGVILL